MKCNKCNAEWKVDASRSASITVCPFCQENIVAEKIDDWKFFDNTKELMEYVATQYGNDALFGKKHFSDHTSPMMPQGQKNLVKQAFSCGAVTILHDNVNSDKTHKEIAVKQAVSKLIDTYASANEAAERVIWEFTDAIGWGMAEPAGSAPHIPPQPQPQPQKNRATSSGYSAENFTKRGYISLGDSEWGKASGFFDNALNIDADYAPAYLGLICVDLKVLAKGKLVTVKDPSEITKHKYYRLAVADPAIKTQLDGYIQTINERIDAEQKAAAAEAERRRKAARRKRVQDKFDITVMFMNKAQSPDDYHKAIAAFGSIDSSYQDINSQIESKIAEAELKCKAAEEAERRKRVQDAFDNAVIFMNKAQSPDDYSKAIAAFGSIDSSYQDINSRIKNQIANCETKIFAIEEVFRNKYGLVLDRLSAEGKIRARQRRLAAQAELDEENQKAFADVEAQRIQIKKKHDADHRAWQVECRRIKAVYDAEYKKWETETNAIMERAEQWKSQGLCPRDGGMFKGLLSKKCTLCGKAPSESIIMPTAPTKPSYPSVPRMPLIPSYTPKKLIKKPDILADVVATIRGDFVFVKLGDIEWRVLVVEKNKALLISEKIIEKRAYNIENIKTTWDNCTLREYLNDEFYNKLGVAKSEIANTCNSNPNNSWYATEGGNTTNDKVFLLSLDELIKYFGDSGDLRNKKRNIWKNGKIVPNPAGHHLHDQYNSARIANLGEKGAWWWWLRSPGGSDIRATNVSHDGSLYMQGSRVDIAEGGVRPALWLNL